MDSPNSLHIVPKLPSTNTPDFPSKSLDKDLSTLKSDWTTLYKQTLPSLARSKAPSQPHWPVHLDHCFARIILDTVIGKPTSTSDSCNTTRATPTPWTARITSPAIQHMTAQQITDCITLGGAIADGKVDLVELDQQSLSARGKTKGQGQGQGQSQKRKSRPQDTTPPSSKKQKPPSNQPDIRTALGLPSPAPSSSSASPAAPTDNALLAKITLSPLTPFRKRVLLALCQVPRGSFTTYLALSNHLDSSPRAVGNVLRNNPFAPRVPCHRVVAADLSIGGFGGEWGVRGKHYGEKVGLLSGEGVEVLEREGRVRGVVWEGFV